MKTFACTNCGNRVYFENTTCVQCTSALGFDPHRMAMVALGPGSAEGLYRQLRTRGKAQLSYCANEAHGVCNWLVVEAKRGSLCRACSLNRTIPNLDVDGNVDAWRALEHAKKRLVYGLMRFGLPFDAPDLPQGPLTFDFKENAMTGHADGVITVDVAETDAVERERVRQQFDEPYRSLLGHLRHESGHFYWTLLVEHAGRADAFRKLFGDEREDYGEALARHHGQGPRPDWNQNFVSAYAGAHPWEDWAETWAHYLHMVDALDTAHAVGLREVPAGFFRARQRDVYRDVDFETLVRQWVPLASAMNSLSRSMGHQDFYPFVIPPPAMGKLAWVHDAIRAGRR